MSSFKVKLTVKFLPMNEPVSKVDESNQLFRLRITFGADPQATRSNAREAVCGSMLCRSAFCILKLNDKILIERVSTLAYSGDASDTTDKKTCKIFFAATSSVDKLRHRYHFSPLVCLLCK